MSKETRDRIAFRMQPETRRRIEQWYAADNCQSKNEFIEKAVNFYVDYLGIQDNTTLLPMAIMSAIDGRLSRLEDYIARRDFTRCVEQDMTNSIAAISNTTSSRSWATSKSPSSLSRTSSGCTAA